MCAQEAICVLRFLAIFLKHSDFTSTQREKAFWSYKKQSFLMRIVNSG